ALLNFKVHLQYPSYLKKEQEVMESPGDLTVPEGTSLSWTFATEHTEELYFEYLAKKYTLQEKKENQFYHQLKVKQSGQYTLLPKNSSEQESALSYRLNVIPDVFPQLLIEEKPDSANTRVLYFIGKANDDYGISKINF